MPPSRRDLRLTGVDLSNIGGFERFSVSFGSETAVLVGANASGKTVLLDAIASGLGALFVGMENFERVTLLRADQRRQLIREDLGLVTQVRPTPVSVTLHALLDGAPVQWMVTPRGRRSILGSAAAAWGKDVEQRVGRQERIDLPVIAHYPAARVRTGQHAFEDTVIEGRLDAYAESLPARRSVASLARWMRRLAYGAQQSETPSVHLQALTAAVCSAVPEIRRFEYSIKAEEVFVGFVGGQTQPFWQLSDGYRNLVGIVADLAWRMLMLNPHLGHDGLTGLGGLVLIDEVDLHLHPGWQRRVLTGLTAAFPKVQFIVTTHSPQVLASAKREWVQILGAETARPAGPVEGRDSNSILVDVFGVGERDSSWQAEIDAVFQRIDVEDFAGARARLGRLEAFWGASDPEVVRAHTMLAMLEPR